MHDVTEGGLCTCLHELGDSSDLGFVVEEEAVLFPDDAQATLRALKFDPYSCSSTGSLLAAVPQERVERALEVLEGLGVEARMVGRFMEGEQRVIRDSRGGLRPLPMYQPDPFVMLTKAE